MLSIEGLALGLRRFFMGGLHTLALRSELLSGD